MGHEDLAAQAWKGSLQAITWLRLEGDWLMQKTTPASGSNAPSPAVPGEVDSWQGHKGRD